MILYEVIPHKTTTREANVPPGKGLQWNLDEDVDFEFTISRKAQAAAKKAAKKGETSADWGDDDDDEGDGD